MKLKFKWILKFLNNFGNHLTGTTYYLNRRQGPEDGEGYPENTDQSCGIVTGKIKLTNAKGIDEIGEDHFATDVKTKETK